MKVTINVCRFTEHTTGLVFRNEKWLGFAILEIKVKGYGIRVNIFYKNIWA